MRTLLTTLDFVRIRDVRANYKQRKVVVVVELILTDETLNALLPVVQVAQSETPVRLTVDSVQQTLLGIEPR